MASNQTSILSFFGNDKIAIESTGDARESDAKADDIEAHVSGTNGSPSDVACMVNFGAMHDPNGWNGPSISGDTIVRRFVEDTLHKEHLYIAMLNSTTATMAKADHTFAVVKRLKSFNGSVFDALFTVMNERGEVIAMQLTSTTSMEEVKELLVELRDRLSRMEHSIKEFWVDNCCQVSSVIKTVFKGVNKVRLDLFHAIKRISE